MGSLCYGFAIAGLSTHLFTGNLHWSTRRLLLLWLGLLWLLRGLSSGYSLTIPRGVAHCHLVQLLRGQLHVLAAVDGLLKV